MTVQRPSGKQLDIESIATELTTDVGALAVLDAEYLRVDNTNNVSGVDLSSDQTISGEKTFSDTVTINADFVVNGTTTTVNTDDLAIVDNIITVNNGEVGAGISLGSAGIEIDRGTLNNQSIIFDEADDTWKLGESGSLTNIATEDYVGNNFIPTEGGEIKSATDNTQLSLHGRGGNANLYFKNDVGVSGVIYNGSNNINLLKYHTVDGGTNTQLALTNDVITSNKPIQGIDPTASNHLTTRSYVDTNFLELDNMNTMSGGNTWNGSSVFNGYNTFNGTVRFTSNPGVQRDGYPSLTLNRTDVANTYGLHQISFQADGVEKGYVKYHQNAEKMLFRVDVDGGTATTVDFDVDGVLSNKQFRTSVAAPTDDAHLTRKDYVDDSISAASIGGGVTDHGALTGLDSDDHPQYMKKSGEKMSGNLEIEAYNASISLDDRNSGTTEGIPVVNFGSVYDATTYYTAAQMYYIPASDRFSITKRDNTAVGKPSAANAMDIYGDRIELKTDPRTTTMGTDLRSLTTKAYVDDNFLKLTGGSLTGDLAIDNAYPVLDMKAANGTDSVINFYANNIKRCVIYNDESTHILKLSVRSTSNVVENELQVREEYTSSEMPVLTQSQQPDIGHSLTRKDYVDGKTEELNNIGDVNVATADRVTGSPLVWNGSAWAASDVLNYHYILPNYAAHDGYDGNTPDTYKYTCKGATNAYVPGTNRTNNQVFVNGVKQREGVAYSINGFAQNLYAVEFNTGYRPSASDLVEIYIFAPAV